MPTADEIRAAQRALWDEFSPGWEKWDDVVQRLNGPVGEAMIGSLELRPDQEHLDVAAGTGDPGLTIASLAPEGRVPQRHLSTLSHGAARSAVATASEISRQTTRLTDRLASIAARGHWRCHARETPSSGGR